MNQEIEKILTLVQEGKIDSAKGAELIQVLQERESVSKEVSTNVVDFKEKQSKQYGDKMLKIRVNSEEGDNVSVNLPIKLIKVLVSAGVNIAGNIPQAEKYVKEVDFDVILQAIENELDGQLVDIKSANGENVSIVIE